tara:strand:- start:169 stop:987 length:819 start_codon:yes stop_codon:yes gene_type:complete
MCFLQTQQAKTFTTKKGRDNVADRIVDIADGFWNIIGSFKIGLLDIGTQASLVRLSSGKFVLLDAYELKGDVKDKVMSLTNDGKDIEAVIHLHPFHTVFVKPVAAMFPEAKQYGTIRHHQKAPELTWEPELTDQPDFHKLYEEDFIFSVPKGVDFIPDNEDLHFASVLAIHKASKTLHVDDTLIWLSFPLIGGLKFHLTFKKVLQKRPGAAAEFRQWANEFIELCGDVKHICAAHAKKEVPSPEKRASTKELVQGAFSRIESTLNKHEKQFG